jgi:chromosome segregation ATPase
VNGGTVAAIVVGVCGLISGLVAAVLSYRAQQKTAQVGEAAAAFEGYDELVSNLRAEVERLRADRLAERESHVAELARRDSEHGVDRDRWEQRAESALAELGDCEHRCRKCRQEIGDLIADLTALRAVVADEIARAAAGTVIDEHADQLEEDRETEVIRNFIRRLAPPKEVPND